MKTLFMETTKVEVGRTVAEIQEILGNAGCVGVMTLYKDKEVEAVCFKIMFLDREIPFRLPARWEAVYKNFVDRRSTGRDKPKHKPDDDIAQAKRVAWRQILRWVQAQLALVETDMVKVQEVFLPYVQTGIEGKTLYEQIENKGFKQLGYSGKD